MELERVPLVEPFAVQDDTVTGIDHIEMVGTSLVRFHLFIEQGDGTHTERILVRKILIPVDCLPKAVRDTLHFMAMRGIELGKATLARLAS